MSTAPVLPPEEQERFAVTTGLRVAVASSVCILLGSAFHLDLVYMSVFSGLIVMAQYPFTSFQKGVERIIGRGAGIGFGLLLALGFRNLPLLFLVLLLTWQLAAFYLYASNRLAYTALQAGIFVPTVAYLGVLGEPDAAIHTAVAIFIQVVLGVGVAMLITWGTGAEHSVHIEAGGEPLLPLRPDWLSRSAMLTTSSVVTMFATLALELPVIPAVVSALILAMTTDAHALRLKAGQRVLGVVFGGTYSLAALLLLTRQSHFPLLLALTALGMFVAAYATRASAKYSYVGLQSGVVMAMVMVGPTDASGSPSPAVQRFIGILVGLVVSVTVHVLWEVGDPAEE